jgi:hypothetical protein
MKSNEFPAGWDEQTIREIVEYYEAQTDEEAAAEHGGALDKIADELRNARPRCRMRRFRAPESTLITPEDRGRLFRYGSR